MTGRLQGGVCVGVAMTGGEVCGSCSGEVLDESHAQCAGLTTATLWAPQFPVSDVVMSLSSRRSRKL